MKFIASKRSASGVINLTPLIDCMFLLVIFIMLAARFDPDTGIAVDLPVAKSGESKKVTSINVSVTEDGSVFLEKEPVNVEDLERLIIQARTDAGDPEGEDVVLVVNGDTNAHHGRVVEVLDAAARAKQKKVTIRTKE